MAILATLEALLVVGPGGRRFRNSNSLLGSFPGRFVFRFSPVCVLCSRFNGWFLWVVVGALIRGFFHVGVDAFSFGKRGTHDGLSVSVFATLHGQVAIAAGLVLKAFHFYLRTTV